MKVVESISDRRLKNVEKKLRGLGLLKIDNLTNDQFNSYCKSYGNKDNRLILLKIMRKVEDLVTANLDGTYQCRSGARRSMGDLYRLFLTYGPNISFKKFRSVLFQLVNQRVINLSYCSTIYKRVVYLNFDGIRNYKINKGNPYISGRETKDEFKFDLKVELNEEDKRLGYH